ncbi:TonB-dependent receptor [Halioxenophilus sp. WMMB6]|uniref:TonB-dependent receptor n=1 Tax=Halioxenophilus sp. WMMB6 TaxID=3073815 RepID=UPI00295F226A|nr:TonB-dependent receptor [Halioxenophilus sp. WMMB6]
MTDQFRAKLRLALPFALSGLGTGAVWAQTDDQVHQPLEEVVVTGQLQKSLAETALPVSVLSDEQLRQQQSTNLGDTLKNIAGVHSSSFGSGVGRPIIRGQTGNRVRVLQGSLGTLDASSVSPDHANGISPLAAERVEVVRGPATLLYGNGAIGGVINVIDNRIASEPLSPRAVFDISHNSNNQQNTGALLLEQPWQNWNWHLDGSRYSADDSDIPVPANPEQADEYRGVLENSDREGDSITLGSSYLTENGYLGLAVSRYTTNYGLPEGLHEHADAEAEEADVRIDLEQTRYEFKAGRDLNGLFNSLEASLAYTDYQHRELEVTSATTEVGTQIANQGFDSRFTLSHNPLAGWQGVVGLQLQQREFGATGEEGYILPTDIASAGLFAVESLDIAQWTIELGARLEHNQTELHQGCKQSSNTTSASASLLRPVSQQSSAWVSASWSERAATEEELYSNIDPASCSHFPGEALVTHAATGFIELGNPELDRETSQNLELGWRRHQGLWTAEVNLYYNQINNYIYAANSDQADAPELFNLVADSDTLLYYSQADAHFYGAELSATGHLYELTSHHLDWRLQGDWVRAQLDSGSNVPRLAPARLGTELAWVGERWTVSLDASHVFSQTHTAPGETNTDGYTLVGAYADYHFLPNGQEWTLYLRGNNLLDEEVRDHTSFIKDAAPAPGIGVEVGLRVTL